MKIAVITKNTNEDFAIRDSVLSRIPTSEGFDFFYYNNASMIDSDCSKILVFGGDGTVLEAVKGSCNLDIPILAINLGKLGFLAELESDVPTDQLISALKSTKTQKRMLLKSYLSNEGDNKVKFLSLNDVVVKSNSTRPIYIKLYVDDNYVDTYHGDGLIVSTPTGSTAYSLSAGGPILSPLVDAIIINPVCPHSLHSRTLVISASSNVRMDIYDDDALLVIDGAFECVIPKMCHLYIEKSNQNATFSSIGKSDFYKKLLDKMNRWGTTQN